MDFDLLLYRPLKNGIQFNDLIPKTTCKSTHLGNGSTDFSISEMAKVINEFNWQTEKVAALLQTSNLQDNVLAIKDFAYSHFQYLADGEEQMLRTPACSWFTRHIGIDCKSYSIIASCLLTNMNIKHSIRKIKQPGFAPHDFTHVYVIVPKNQNTGDLKDGYFTIDGTLKSNSEPLFIEKQDLIMKHSRLNAPFIEQQGLGLGFGLDDVKNAIKNLKCIGGSAYDDPKLQSNITKIASYFDGILMSINNAIATKDHALLSEEVNEFFGGSKIFVATYEKKLSSGWNRCSTKNFQATIKICKFYRDGVGAALNVYIDQFFIKGQSTGNINYTGDGMEQSQGFWGMHLGNPVTISEPKYAYTVKPGTTAIPRFEITPYVAAQLENPSSINPVQLLQGLTTIIASFQPQNSNGSGQNYPIDPSTGQQYQDLPAANPTQSGMGNIVGLLLIAGGVAWGVTKFSSNKK